MAVSVSSGGSLHSTGALTLFLFKRDISVVRGGTPGADASAPRGADASMVISPQKVEMACEKPIMSRHCAPELRGNFCLAKGQ